MSDFSPTAVAPGNCPACGKPLKSRVAEGLCVRCLLGSALELPGSAPQSEGEDSLLGSLLAGKTVGGYQLVGTIASGGMGTVFKARQRHPDRLVALKVISAGELATRAMVERFHTEALAAARLDHPNIVPIFEVGQDQGWHYFSMQFVEGRTLADRILDGAPQPRAAVEVLLKVARAVEHAHQRGILHRDLKPTNILLDAQGEPYLTDFGLAKVLEQDSDLTHSGAVLGTPAYMSPEQAAGRSRDITTATDVYGLGAIFYELLSGRPPFRAASTPALLRMIAEDEAVFSGQYSVVSEDTTTSRTDHCSLNTDYSAATATDRDLQVICLKCLEKEPAKRYATAGALADELARWLRHEPILARPVGSWERAVKWTRRNRARAAFFATVILASLVLTVVSLLFNVRLNRAREEAQRNAAEARAQLFRDHLSQASRLIEGDDAFFGALWAAAALKEAGPDEAARQRARDRLQLTFQFAPRLLRLLVLDPMPTSVRFGPDGKSLRLEGPTHSLRIWALAADTVTQVPDEALMPIPQTAPPSWLAGSERQESFVFSPDGATVATVGVDYAVRLRRAGDGRVLHPLLHHAASVVAMAFSSDGRFLATVSSDLTARVWDLAGPVAPAFTNTLPVTRPAFSPDGARILAVIGTNTFRLCDAFTGAVLSDSLDAGGKVASAAFERIGGHFATATDRGLIRVWDSTSLRRVAELPAEGPFLSLEFSPDGQTLAAANYGGRAWVWRWAESGEAREIAGGAGARRIEWSPDGTLFLIVGEGGVQLWSATELRPLDQPMLLALYGFTARFNPQGNLVFASFQQQKGEPGAAQVLAVPSLASVGAPVLHGDGVRDVRFTPDGRFVVSSGADSVIRVRHPATGLPALPVMHHPAAVNNTGFSSDQRWLVSCGVGGVVRFWEMASGQILAPTLHLPAELYEAALSVSNRSLVVRGALDFSWLLPLKWPDLADRDWADWVVLASGHSRDAVGGINAVAAPELARRLNDQRQRRPQDFAWPGDSALWHGQQAAFARHHQDWRAAVFHFERLAKLRPDDAEVADRLRAAKAKIEE